jgi:hypothetical protein
MFITVFTRAQFSSTNLCLFYCLLVIGPDQVAFFSSCFSPAAISKSFSTINAFYGVVCQPHAQPHNLEDQGIRFRLDHHL